MNKKLHILLAGFLAVILGIILGGIWASLNGTSFAPAVLEEREKVRSLSLDLDKKLLTLLEGDKIIAALPILAVPKTGSPWEIAPGHYRVGAREELHRSPLTNDAYPYAVQLDGNAFLHGPPAPRDIGVAAIGKVNPTKKTKKGKSIETAFELGARDATRVFDFARIGDPVEVLGGRSGLAQFGKVFENAGNLVQNAFAAGKPPLIRAHAYLIGDLKTGEVLLERNAHSSLPIASVTKLLTARVALKFMDPSAHTTLSGRSVATYGSQGELKAGENFSVGELLYPLFLESSNDAAEALAEMYGREKFISVMNEEAKALGMTNSSFVDPAGLDPMSKSSARDLFVLARKMYETDSSLIELTRTKEKRAGGHLWSNSNKLVRKGDERYLGGKTGYIPEAGLTSVSLFSFPTGEFERKDLAIILLRSVNRDKDINSLLRAYAPKNNLVWEDATEETAADTASLIFVGDIMSDRLVRATVRADLGGDYNELFNFAPALKTADIAFANLEGPLSDKGYDLGNTYSFRMDPQFMPALINAGFDALSIANNHIGDWGRAAFEDTLSHLRAANIAPVGAGESEAIAREPGIIERNGIRVGFLGFSDVGPQWLAEPRSQSVVLMASNPEIKTIIENAKEKVEHLVVSFHFGEEYQKEPTARQINFAHSAIDAGADIVVGHHPHVAQPIERYNGGVIAYSLGNFIFDQSFSKETMESFALELVVDKDEILEVKQHKVKINEHFQPTID